MATGGYRKENTSWVQIKEQLRWAEGNTMSKWRTGKLQSDGAKKLWILGRFINLKKMLPVVPRSLACALSRFPGLQAAWPTTLCRTLTSVSITSVCTGADWLSGKPLNWLYLSPIAILTYTHLGMLFPVITTALPFFFFFLTEAFLVVQCSPISFLKDCHLVTFLHFLLVITLIYIALVLSECHPNYYYLP